MLFDFVCWTKNMYDFISIYDFTINHLSHFIFNYFIIIIFCFFDYLLTNTKRLVELYLGFIEWLLEMPLESLDLTELWLKMKFNKLMLLKGKTLNKEIEIKHNYKTLKDRWMRKEKYINETEKKWIFYLVWFLFSFQKIVLVYPQFIFL